MMTVGELGRALSHFPDEMEAIISVDGDAYRHIERIGEALYVHRETGLEVRLLITTDVPAASQDPGGGI